MNIDMVAAQVRSLCPIFNGNVAGAAAYPNSVEDQVWLPLPAAYVIPGGGDAEENTSMTGLYQIVHERFSIIVVLRTLDAGGVHDPADRRGQAPASYLQTVEFALYRAVLNWRPDWPPDATNREGRGIYYVGSGFAAPNSWDRARFFYQWTFGLDTTITDADGWQQPFDPLVLVDGEITQPSNPMAEVVDVKVPLPPDPNSPF